MLFLWIVILFKNESLLVVSLFVESGCSYFVLKPNIIILYIIYITVLYIKYITILYI